MRALEDIACGLTQVLRDMAQQFQTLTRQQSEFANFLTELKECSYLITKVSLDMPVKDLERVALIPLQPDAGCIR